MIQDFRNLQSRSFLFESPSKALGEAAKFIEQHEHDPSVSFWDVTFQIDVHAKNPDQRFITTVYFRVE